MHWDRTVWSSDEGDLGGFCNIYVSICYKVGVGGGVGVGVRTNWICISKLEFQAECLIYIDRIRIEDSDIHKPLCEAIGSNQAYSWW